MKWWSGGRPFVRIILLNNKCFSQLNHLLFPTKRFHQCKIYFHGIHKPVCCFLFQWTWGWPFITFYIMILVLSIAIVELCGRWNINFSGSHLQKLYKFVELWQSPDVDKDLNINSVLLTKPASPPPLSLIHI